MVTLEGRRTNLTRWQVEALRTLRSRLERIDSSRCGFTRPGDFMSSRAYTDEVDEVTRVWRQTYVLPLIDAILDGRPGDVF